MRELPYIASIPLLHRASPMVCEPGFVLDIGGEGRHADAWNLNPSRRITLGPQKGTPIPRHLLGRAEQIPLPSHCVDRILMERTPLRREAVLEIRRVIAPDGEIVLRHARSHGGDPHEFAITYIGGFVETRLVSIGRQSVQESQFRMSRKVFRNCQCNSKTARATLAF